MEKDKVQEAKWYNDHDRIIGKIIIDAQLQNSSPLIVGSGQDINSDNDCVKLSDNQAYLPGSVLAGCIQSRWKEFELVDKKVSKLIWGTEGEDMRTTNGESITNSVQSHIVIEDALSTAKEKGHFTVKDGVKIEYKTNQAVDKGKYDFEILEPGLTFPFKAEITLRKGMDKSQYTHAAFHILSILKNDFRLGAKTTSGFGKMQMDENSAKVYFFDFVGKGKNDADKWFAYLEGDLSECTPEEEISIECRSGYDFSVSADFRIKSSLLSRTYLAEADAPDHVHTYRGNNTGQPILHGSSIKGAIRHRAYKILNTIKDEKKSELIVDQLFGWVCESDKEYKCKIKLHQDPNLPKAKKGRIRIEESIIENADNKTEQTRIKIDRFTGGTIDGALIQSRPVWSKGDDQNLTIKWAAKNVKPHEITLMLMVLKDLWTADLAIGGDKAIGRGVLDGRKADITIYGKTLWIENIDNAKPEKGLKYSDEAWEILEQYNDWENINWENLYTGQEKET